LRETEDPASGSQSQIPPQQSFRLRLVPFGTQLFLQTKSCVPFGPFPLVPAVRSWESGVEHRSWLLTRILPARRNRTPNIDIHTNPVRRGICQTPRAWPWSSAAEYERPGSGLLRLDQSSLPRTPPFDSLRSLMARQRVGIAPGVVQFLPASDDAQGNAGRCCWSGGRGLDDGAAA
jgi:hypothetical protein